MAYIRLLNAFHEFLIIFVGSIQPDSAILQMLFGYLEGKQNRGKTEMINQNGNNGNIADVNHHHSVRKSPSNKNLCGACCEFTSRIIQRFMN